VTKYGIQAIFTCSPNLPAGPYFLSVEVGTVFQAFRLYPDVQGAFTQGILPDGKNSFTALPAAVASIGTATVAVPSRLYYTQTVSQPLAGVRLGVKDIYDIEGVKTSGGNRAYYDFYPPANATSPIVQVLVDAGAVIIGKLKVCYHFLTSLDET
jgi:hypothetical protein